MQRDKGRIVALNPGFYLRSQDPGSERDRLVLYGGEVSCEEGEVVFLTPHANKQERVTARVTRAFGDLQFKVSSGDR